VFNGGAIIPVYMYGLVLPEVFPIIYFTFRSLGKYSILNILYPHMFVGPSNDLPHHIA
jgi:hypothetical protein